MNERLPVLLVGCGHQGLFQLRHMRAEPTAELVGVIDPDPEARAAAGAGTPTYPSLEAFLAGPGAKTVAAAVVAVPTPAHAEVGAACLDAGWSVLIEKPLAGTREEARRLVAAEGQGLLRVGHIERFNPAVIAAEPSLGTPLFVEGHRLGPFRERMDEVDVVLDLMVHDLDLLLRWTGGEVIEVRAAGAQVLTDRVDIANARLQFDTGCVANLTASRASLELMRKLRVFAPDRYLSVDFAGHRAQLLRRLPPRPGEEHPQITDESPEVDGGADALAAQFRAFLDEARAHRQGAALEAPERLATAEQAAKALDLAHTIREAVEEHRQRVERV